jgi:hypothetical protein
MYLNSISSFFFIPIQICIRQNHGISDTICIREGKKYSMKTIKSLFLFRITNYLIFYNMLEKLCTPFKVLKNMITK